MKPSHLLGLVVLSGGIYGCPTRNKYDRTPTVRITSPTAATFTNGTIHLAAALDPPLGLPIVLLRDGVEFTTLQPPSYDYPWDTTKSLEGSYVIAAEVAFSDDVVMSSAVTITVDRTPPQVTSRVPEPDAMNVALRAPIQIEFSEAIAPSPAAIAAFSVSAGDTSLASTVTFNAGNRKAAIAISDVTSLLLPARLSIAIASGIKDLAGNSLSLPSTNWAWDVPAWFKTPPLSTVTAPELAIGANGQPFLVHTEGVAAAPDFPRRLHVSRYDGVAWIELGTISGTIGQPTFESYSLAVDPGGQPALAFVEANAGASIIKVQSWDGTAWKPPLPDLDRDGDPTGTRPRIPIVRVTPNGSPIVAWRELTAAGGSSEDIFVARWDGNQWDMAFGGAGLTVVSGHALALDGAGDPVLGWSTDRGSALAVWNGTTRTVSPMLIENGFPSLSVDLEGRPVFLSSRGPSFNFNVLVAGAWQAGFGPLPTGTFAQLPRLILGPDAAPVVAWIDSAGPTRVGVARWTGSTWDTRIGLFYDGGNVAFEPPLVATDATGSIWVCWRDYEKVNVWKSNY